jgi:hypothetical protein
MDDMFMLFYPDGQEDNYTILCGTSDDLLTIEKSFDVDPESSFRRIDRAEAIRLAETLPAEAKASGKAWYGGWCSDSSIFSARGHAVDVESRIAACRAATTRFAQDLKSP